jgi:glycosyltransferase involved in cell wall biosynthesis
VWIPEIRYMSEHERCEEKMNDRTISAFFPTYNELDNLPLIVEKMSSVLRRFSSEWEIIIVDDGSTDGTSELADRLAQADRRVRVVHHGENKGFGAALRSGIEASRMELVFYTDADNQFDVEELAAFLPPLEKADLVVGYRVDRQDPPLRLFVARVYNLMIRFMVGLAVRDIDCSFKLGKRSVLQSFRLVANTGLGDAELLLKAKRRGARIVELPVRHFHRTLGSVSYELPGTRRLGIVRPSVPLKILWETVRLWKEMRGG